jgi:hypothetical protein
LIFRLSDNHKKEEEHQQDQYQDKEDLDAPATQYSV